MPICPTTVDLPNSGLSLLDGVVTTSETYMWDSFPSVQFFKPLNGG